MGVYLDKFFGFMLDVTEEYEKSLNENDDDIIFEKFISCNMEEINKDLKDLNYVPYYNGKKKPEKNDITLITDGMCGEYYKIIFINNFENYCSDEYDSEEENKYLQTIPVPNDIVEKITNVYNIIFGKTNKQLDIKLMKFNHYH